MPDQRTAGAATQGINMVLFYKKWKKYNEIQLTENKMDFDNRKISNQPPSPRKLFEN